MTRRITGRLSAAVAIAAFTASAASRRSKKEPVQLSEDTDEFSSGMANVYFKEPNPRHEPNHGKRGGNGKGRKWWNKN